jgi:hypothetical protein
VRYAAALRPENLEPVMGFARTAVELSSAEPLPSCPYTFERQQFTVPFARVAHVWM